MSTGQSDSVVDERTLREIYLTGFEIAVREAKPMCLMKVIDSRVRELLRVVGKTHAAKNYLYVIANSNAMNGVDSDTVVKNIKPGWQKAVTAVPFIVALIDVIIIFAVRRLWGRKRHA